MAQLVRDDSLDFVSRELAQQRVAQDDPPAGADAGEGRVGRLGALAHIEPEHAADPRLVTLRQPPQPLGQVGVLRPERHELIEQGRDQHGRHQRQDDDQRKIARCCPQPPGIQKPVFQNCSAGYPIK